ncbi:hypothetical protein [Saccharopolyspora endophytica]|uniref:Uncharacterized protein n=1 Tax=Saccharopolyspora endophytica TaxID=543886 RepID=A0ABS5DQK0_9PSEU|nr:hypothetical protein [Saccharopolyspora endophytica]MBQ0928581.1 hypothetical protein [Saccharopolyspora endophytica]
MFRVEITRYEGLHTWTERIQWADTWHHLSALQALEILRYHCSGFLAEDTVTTVTDEDTDKPIDDRELARIAHNHAHLDHTQRSRFAEWVSSQVHDFLWPWDDGVTLAPPPWSYWRRAACWTRRTLGRHLDEWLIDSVNRSHTGFREALERHEELISADPSRCWRC